MKIINSTIVSAVSALVFCVPCAAPVFTSQHNTYCESDSVMCAIPSDSGYLVNKSYYEKIDMESAWDINKGNSSVKVGIIDSGVENHIDLNGRISTTLSYDVTQAGSPLSDSISGSGHGTAVAGVIGAIGGNGIGTSGVCWDGVTLVSYKVDVYSDSGAAADIAEAINRAGNDGVKLLNISLGVTATNELKTAINNYSGLIVCSAGNESINVDNNARFSSLPNNNLLVVGATRDMDDNIQSYSNYGAVAVDLFAPGEVFSTVRGNSFGSVSGTSFSSPLVAGVAALIMAKYPGLSMSDVKNTILNNVDVLPNLSGKCVTGGRLNAYKALTNISCSHAAVKYVKRDAIMHDSVCTTCGQVTGSGMHVLLDSIAGYKICKICKYKTMIGFKPGGDYNSIGDEQLSAQGADGETLCEDCAEHSHETTVIDELEELKESLVA